MKAVRDDPESGPLPEALTPVSGALREARRAERRTYVHFTWFQCIDPCVEGPDRGVGRSCDVAESGLGFVTAHALAKGCRLFLVLVAPAGRVAALGTVMHCRKEGADQYRVGVSIDLVPPTDQPTWAAMSRSAPP